MKYSFFFQHYLSELIEIHKFANMKKIFLIIFLPANLFSQNSMFSVFIGMEDTILFLQMIIMVLLFQAVIKMMCLNMIKLMILDTALDFPKSGRGYVYGVSIGDHAYIGFGSTDNGSFPTDWGSITC